MVQANDVLGLLVGLVDRQLSKSIPHTSDQLVSAGAKDATHSGLAVALEMLREREVVRPTVMPGSGQTAWVLDHDYLCRGVLEAERRSSRWQLILDEGHRTWKETRGNFVRAWWALLQPWRQPILMYHRLRGRVRYGTAAPYAAASLLRFVPLLAVVTLVAWGAYRIRTALYDAKAEGLIQSIGGEGSTISTREWRSIMELAAQPRGLRRLALVTGLTSQDARLDTHDICRLRRPGC